MVLSLTSWFYGLSNFDALRFGAWRSVNITAGPWDSSWALGWHQSMRTPVDPAQLPSTKHPFTSSADKTLLIHCASGWHRSSQQTSKVGHHGLFLVLSTWDNNWQFRIMFRINERKEVWRMLTYASRQLHFVVALNLTTWCCCKAE